MPILYFIILLISDSTTFHNNSLLNVLANSNFMENFKFYGNININNNNTNISSNTTFHKNTFFKNTLYIDNNNK